MSGSGTGRRNVRDVLHEIIFEANTPAGKWFDVLLILSILTSVTVVMADSVGTIRVGRGRFLLGAEWFFTVLFSIEYVLRLISVRSPLRYATSFYGVVDFIAIVPTYLSLIFPATKYFVVLRILRILRVFRVLKLIQYLKEANLLMRALSASRRKITVFLFTVLTLVTIFGSLMYVIEGEVNGFTSIPKSVYWAIVTMTTVGYGDLSPQTALGQALASLIMILGYSIIAVPTGIVTVQISQAMAKGASTQACSNCGREGHDPDAAFCKFCGERL
ncbi:MAG: ion transporter [bacterium]|nr:MAG: ion transporter [bacterium]